MVVMSGMPRPGPSPTRGPGDQSANLQGVGPRPGAVAGHMTAARTGTTFDMADLITHGTATKVPRKLLPSTDAKMKVLLQTEATMPGDLMGTTEKKTAVERLCKVIVDRNLDLLNLMDDYMKRPRGSKMPVRNRAFMDVSDFRRALCYAMGDQWTGLAISAEEFTGLYKPYVRKDAGHESRLGNVQNFVHEQELILWMSFARDVQRQADGTGLNEAQQMLFDAEQELADKASAMAKKAEAELDADQAYAINKGAMKARQAAKAEALKVPCGQRGCTLGEVEHAKAVIAQKLVGAGGKHDTVREALQDLDESKDGTLSREEIIFLLNENYIMKYRDFYTGMERGELSEPVVQTLLDMCDRNGDGKIDYDEFSNIVLAGANTYFGGDELYKSTTL